MEDFFQNIPTLVGGALAGLGALFVDFKGADKQTKLIYIAVAFFGIVIVASIVQKLFG